MKFTHDKYSSFVGAFGSRQPYICEEQSAVGPSTLHKHFIATVLRIIILIISKIYVEDYNFAYSVIFFAFNVSAWWNFLNGMQLRVKLDTDFVTIFLHLQDCFIPWFFQMIIF